MNAYTDPAKTREELTAEWLERRLARGLHADYAHPLRKELEDIAYPPRHGKDAFEAMQFNFENTPPAP